MRFGRPAIVRQRREAQIGEGGERKRALIVAKIQPLRLDDGIGRRVIISPRTAAGDERVADHQDAAAARGIVKNRAARFFHRPGVRGESAIPNRERRGSIRALVEDAASVGIRGVSADRAVQQSEPGISARAFIEDARARARSVPVDRRIDDRQFRTAARACVVNAAAD